MKPAGARPPRFAISAASDDGHGARVGDFARIEDGELHHLRDVMRLGPGAAVRLIAGGGAEFDGRVAFLAADHAEIEITGIVERGAAHPGIILATALIKGPRMDFTVEKAAELGAIALWPLVCARAVVRNPGAERIARWRRLAIAAAKQSLSPHRMEIRPPLTVAEAAREVPKGTLAAVCTEGADPLGAIVRRTRPHAMLIVCGPEGDFDAGEYATMHAAGFVAAGLGPNRLRSETAALAALSLAAGALDEIERGI
jgi:16S rRNA (uracil1498-N3)-methyltransferase